MKKNGFLIIDDIATSYFGMYYQNIRVNVHSFCRSFLEENRSSNISFGLLTTLYYTMSTQLDLAMFGQHILLFCIGTLVFALTFRHRTSTFVMRLFLLSIPYLTLFTEIKGDLRIESEVWQDTLNIFYGLIIPVFTFVLYRSLQQKYHSGLEIEESEKQELFIAKGFEQRCNFHMQDLQMELKRRQLAREIIAYSELGGTNIEPRFLQRDICSQDIHRKIKMLAELQNFEKLQKERAQANKKMRSLYVEYKKSLLSSS